MEHLTQHQNLPSLFFDQAARFGDKPFLWQKQDGTYRPWRWTEISAQIISFAAALKGLGVQPGDRVVLVSESRPEWFIADFAIMSVGGITVPAYTTNTPSDHHHVLTDSGARLAIVSTAKLAKPLFAAVARVPEVTTVISLEEASPPADLGAEVQSWAALLDSAMPDEAAIIDTARALARTDPCCIIYTSGTGGAPKGVTLSHGGIMANCIGSMQALGGLPFGEEVFLSFLPLSHSFEHMAGQFLPVFLGAQIYYAEGIDALTRNMAEARPTIMTAVPRLYESMYARISPDILKNQDFKAKLFEKTVALGARAYQNPRDMGLLDKLMNRALDRLVREKIQARFGGRLKALVSGGAPLPEEIGLFFTALGLRLLQGYGQTESSPVISCNPPEKVKIQTVGPPLPGLEVRIAEDGEIQVRGESVMIGYWNRPEETAKTVIDGWLHTGDVGHFDDDGYIRITDRKKDIIVNSGGDNLSPQRVEGLLSMEPEIGQAMVYGDRRPYLVALIVPEEGFVKRWARENGKAPDLAALAEDPDFQKAIKATLDTVNKKLSKIEKVRQMAIATEPFTIDNGMMTPTMKVRRHRIIEQYGDRLTQLYG